MGHLSAAARRCLPSATARSHRTDRRGARCPARGPSRQVPVRGCAPGTGHFPRHARRQPGLRETRTPRTRACPSFHSVLDGVHEIGPHSKERLCAMTDMALALFTRTDSVHEIGRRRRRVVFDVHEKRQRPSALRRHAPPREAAMRPQVALRSVPAPWHPATEPAQETVWRTTATPATFAEAVRENEEVVPVNISTWVLSSGVTVGR